MGLRSTIVQTATYLRTKINLGNSETWWNYDRKSDWVVERNSRIIRRV